MTPPGQTATLAAPPPAPERLALADTDPRPPVAATPASLWRSGPTSLFGDRRARRRGDILTVVIEIDDEAEISNETDRSRTGNDELRVEALLGLPSVADIILPGAQTLDPAIAFGSSTSTEGSGSVSREEEITVRIAATVDAVLPNGHLVIRGSQELRINFELRELQVSGIIRPEDISRRNEIALENIADARVVYGGRGQISDVQQPRYGQQIVDIVAPF